MSALLKEIPTPIDSDIDLVHAIADKCMGLNHEQLLAVLFDLNLLKQGIETGHLQLHKLTEELKKEKRKFHYWFGRSSELSSRLKQIELENKILKYQLLKAKEAFDEVLKEYREAK